WTSIALVIIVTIFVISSAFTRLQRTSLSWFTWLVGHIFAITTILILTCSLQTLSGLAGLPGFLIQASASIGTLSWVALFLVVFLLFLVRLQQTSRGAGVYLAALLVVMALLFDWAGLNDNHIIRTIAAAGRPDTFLLSDEFHAWWARRPKDR